MSRLLGVSPESNSIKVVARFRPQNSLEISQNCGECVTFKKELNEVEVKTGDDSPHKFQFDKIFSHPCKQSEVYEYTGKQIVEDVFKGYNGTIFVYGQTGSGKTFSMMGPNTSGLQGYCDDEELKGIIPRVVEDIFKAVEEADENIEFTLKVSYVEVYMERIRDLLDPKKVNLQIHEDLRSGRGIYIAEATEAYVCDPEEVFRLMQAGASNRAVASTRMNDESSRSHSIFQITVTQKHNINLEQKSGKLFLVDLAGSEKVGKTHAMGQQLEEAKLINKSLSCLGMVIHALTDPKATHIPYRDSKLTRLLQDSLGGNSRTTLMICCSPSKYNDQETLSTCRFGERAKTVKNKAKINKEWTVGELKALLEKAEREIYQLKQIKGVSDPEEESKRAQEMADLEREMQEQKKRLTDERDELIHQLTEMKEEFYQQQQLLETMKLEKVTLQEEIELWEKEYTAIHQLYQQSLYYLEREKQSNNDKSRSIDNLLKNSEDLISYISSLKGHITKSIPTNDHTDRVLREQTESSGLRTSTITEEGTSGGGPLSLDAQQEVQRLRKENEVLKQSLLTNNGAPMDLNEYNHSLLRDLQNKCERVIDLEIGLDEARESYRHLVQVSSNKNLKRQVSMLEQEAQERSDSLQDIYNENCTLRLEMQLAEKKLAIRNERIENLKSALKEEKRHYKQLQEQMAIDHEKTSADLSLCQEELNYWKEKALSRERGVLGKGGGGSKKVVKVLKGGQRTTSTAITAMLGTAGVYSRET